MMSPHNNDNSNANSSQYDSLGLLLHNRYLLEASAILLPVLTTFCKVRLKSSHIGIWEDQGSQKKLWGWRPSPRKLPLPLI